jgi:type IV pilus assembly protein PilO
MTAKFIGQILRARPKSFIFIAALVLANVGLYVYVSAYQVPRLAALQSAWFEKRRSVDRSSLKNAAAIYRQGTADLTTWRSRIAPKKDFARVVGDIFETAASNSLKVGGVTYKPFPIKDENLLAYSIGFNVSGKYAAAKSFLADMMRFRDIMTIDNVSLNSSSGVEESVDLKVQLTVYFRTEGR